MTFEISYEPENEEVVVVYDNYLTITAEIDSEDRVVFSKTLAQVDDDAIHAAIKSICHTILAIK